MKVLFISNIPSPYRVEFFNELGKYIDLTVVFEAKKAEKIKFDWKDDYSNFKAIFLSESNIQEKKINFSILKYIKKNAYDYIFATNYSYRTELIAYLKMVFLKIPFVLEIDGGIIKKDENWILKKIKTFLLTKPINYFSPSESSDRFLMYYGAEKEKIIRYNFSSFWEKNILNQPLTINEKNDLKKELGLNNKPLILCVSQIIYRKGIDILVDALNILSEDYQCIIIGEQPDDLFASKIKKEKNKKISLYSFKNTKELEKYYQAADIFVLPTRFDIWGLVINEALAKGLPIITTKGCVAGCELIKNGYNGYIVETENMLELKENIKILLEDIVLRETMGKNALKSISKNTLDNMVNKHLEFLGVNVL